MQERAWAVVHHYGVMLGSITGLRKWAIEHFMEARLERSWRSAKRNGFRCVRVTVLEERPCVWRRIDSAGIWETGCDGWQYEEAIGFPIMTEYPNCPRCRQRVEVGEGE